MAESSLAETLLALALRDKQAFDKLASDPQLHDSLAGFHAQQAVEKALKAVLSHWGVVYRRTHDIAELLDLAADSGLGAPPHADRLDELNPYAVEYRYGLVDPSGLDREETGRMLTDVVAWASGAIRFPLQEDKDPDEQ
jgi:HEPN domain-containing protein